MKYSPNRNILSSTFIMGLKIFSVQKRTIQHYIRKGQAMIKIKNNMEAILQNTVMLANFRWDPKNWNGRIILIVYISLL